MKKKLLFKYVHVCVHVYVCVCVCVCVCVFLIHPFYRPLLVSSPLPSSMETNK